MSPPTPLQSFLGGIGLSLPVHVLLLLNGSVLGIAGFIHRGVLGHAEAASSLVGLILGGAAVGRIEGVGPDPAKLGLGTTILSGLLVGVGTKVSTDIPSLRTTFRSNSCHS